VVRSLSTRVLRLAVRLRPRVRARAHGANERVFGFGCVVAVVSAFHRVLVEMRDTVLSCRTLVHVLDVIENQKFRLTITTGSHIFQPKMIVLARLRLHHLTRQICRRIIGLFVRDRLRSAGLAESARERSPEA
jgi:hypothetical protein